MFGIGFTELLLISIVAILFLGPDKLPQAFMEVAKFIKGVKKTVGDAKSSLEEELNIAELKEEALSYKKQLDDATDELKNFKNIDFDDFDDIDYDSKTSTKPVSTPKPDPYAQAPREINTPLVDDVQATQVEAKNDLVTFTKEKKSEEKIEDATKKIQKKR